MFIVLVMIGVLAIVTITVVIVIVMLIPNMLSGSSKWSTSQRALLFENPRV